LEYLSGTVDQDGDVLDILVQSRRDKKAAKKFFRKLLKGLRYVPRVVITDKLKTTVFLKDMNTFGQMNAVYAQVLKVVPPFRTAVEATRIA
jgi:transposase-like protein